MQAKITQRNLSKFATQPKPYDVRDTELKGFILRVHPTGRKVYYVQYARGKREKLGTVPAVTVEQAREKAKTILAGIMLGHETPAQKRLRAQAHTLKTFIENVYAPWAEEHRKSGTATVARLKARFLDDMGDKILPEITPWVIESWRTKRRKAGTALTTINRDVVALRAALSKAVEWDLLAEHPLKDLKPLKTDKTASIVRYLDDAEEQRLRGALKARDARIMQGRASGNAWREKRGYEPLPGISGPYGDHLTPMVVLSMNTGLRRGELLGLAWANIDFECGTLTVAGESAKSGHTRRIPLNQEARGVLENWGGLTNKTGLVFKGRYGGQLDNVRKSWAGVLKSADIQNFRWHDLRHHFASRLVMNGADIYVVKELLGHSTIAITEKYAHLAPEHKAAAVALLDGNKRRGNFRSSNVERYIDSAISVEIMRRYVRSYEIAQSLVAKETGKSESTIKKHHEGYKQTARERITNATGKLADSIQRRRSDYEKIAKEFKRDIARGMEDAS